MKKLLSASILLAAFWVLPATAQDFNRGFFVYHKGDFATALREWRPLAERGSLLAQYRLGQLYFKGEGVKQDYAEAKKWFDKAAAQQYAPAQNSLGILYSEGMGVHRDVKEAAKWFLHSAEQGYAPAQVRLGQHYKDGRGVPKDRTEAMKWFNIASELGNDTASTHRDALVAQLQPDQVAEARKMASVWLLQNKR